MITNTGCMRKLIVALVFLAVWAGGLAAQEGGLVRIEAGTFLMGSREGEENELPVHRVRVRSFYLGRTEVTQREWTEIMGDNPSAFQGDALPVEGVSWLEAVEYCNRRSIREGLAPVYRGSGKDITGDFGASGYRLPTEAEWEYAARGGGQDGLVFEYAGSNSPDRVAWYRENSGGRPHEAGTKEANSLGLFDMSGNVGEWCWDWYRDRYSAGEQENPTGAGTGVFRVNRGGSWNEGADAVRSAYRGFNLPAERRAGVGLRVARR
jgi:formylglycine-generating enzyme required for sulfatase activity